MKNIRSSQGMFTIHCKLGSYHPAVGQNYNCKGTDGVCFEFNDDFFLSKKVDLKKIKIGFKFELIFCTDEFGDEYYEIFF